MKNKLATAKLKIVFATSLMALLFTSLVEASGVVSKIEKVADAIHLEFGGLTEWNYELSKNGKTVLIKMPKISDKSKLELETWTGPMIESIKVNPGIDGGNELVVNLTNPAVESFDYLTDQPSRLVIDFFIPEEKPVAAPKKAEPKSVVSKAKVAAARKPAASEFIKADADVPTAPPPEVENAELPPLNEFGVFDGGDPDFTRFAVSSSEINPEAEIASRRNIYIRYPMLELEDENLKKLWSAPPQYKVTPEDDEENKQVRFLIVLFEKKRFAAYAKALELFREKYPKSKRYDEMISYMDADNYYNMWLQDKSPTDFETAMAKYNKILFDYPNSKLTQRIYLLVGFSYVFKKNSIGAIATFDKYLRDYPESEYRFLAKMALAKSYAIMRKFKEANELFNDITNDPRAGVYRVEAKYRLGDVAFQQGDYEGAVATYAKAKEQYPSDWRRYPNAHFNRSEGYFWMKDYKQSLDSYVEFLRTFPKNEYGGFAMTRIGEILDILGAPKKKVLGAYLESIFRYHGSEGASLAKIRLTSSRMKNMKEKEIDGSLEEFEKYLQGSKLPMIEPFVRVAISDGFYERGNFDKTLGILIDYYRNNPTSVVLDVFKTRIERTLITQIKDLVDQKQFLETLRLYGQNSSRWLRDSDRIDLMFYLGEAYEQAGSPVDASKLYRDSLNKLYSIRGTQAEKERGVFESLPSSDQLNLRLASVSAKENDFGQSFKYLKDIEPNAKLSRTEDIERVEIAAQVAEARGQDAAAIAYLKSLTENWRGEPEKVSQPLLKLAQIYNKVGDSGSALIALDRIAVLQEDTKSVSLDIHAEALELKGNILHAKKDLDGAVKAYGELLETYEKSRPLQSVRYKLGQIEFKRGNLVAAEKHWSPLEAGSSWASMATEQLEHAKFKDNYKKYIDRIPAMAGLRKGVEE
jgi:tetratricopeptide (TPR) repeat protein